VDQLGRIEQALAKGRLDTAVFEECATDLLTPIYPGISPISGGTDWGRDADIHLPDSTVTLRLLVTTSRTPKGVRSNMAGGLTSMRDHFVPVSRVVLANPAVLNQVQRSHLNDAAREFGVEIVAFYDRRFFASRLRRDGEWRHRLLGLSPDPMSLSALPADLAENPGVSVVLAERSGELADVRQATGDVVVVGKPGVGKTRLVAEIGDVVFVDPYAGIGQIADDLRADPPSLVALDDAGQHVEILRGLVRLRHTEGDVLRFSIVAICWPDETPVVREVLGNAITIDVPLLDPKSIDAIVVGMGVTSLIARNQIVAQAQGRPGWAVTLASLFASQRTWTSLFDGQVVLREVRRFLRQVGAPDDADALLAAIAAVGHVTYDDLQGFRDRLGLDPGTVRQTLVRSAHAGLVDIVTRVDGERVYRVRPQMLADALVADQIFRSPVPTFLLSDLAQDWPDRTPDLARAAINSVRLGAAEARPAARQLLLQLRRNGACSESLERHYAMMDERAGHETLTWIRDEFAAYQPAGHIVPGVFDGAIAILALIARDYLSSDAIDLLLDIARIYRGPDNRSADPLSKLDEIVCHFHPELRPTCEPLRRTIATRLETWIACADEDPRSWAAYAGALKAVLTIRRKVALNSAAEPDRFALYEGILTAAEIEAIVGEVWPTILRRLTQAPLETVKAVIAIVADWLRIGTGRDHPFGLPYPQVDVEAAARAATTLLRDLEPVVARDEGLLDALVSVAARFGVDTGVRPDPEVAAFFAPVEFADGTDASLRQLRAEIGRTVRSWSSDSPHTVARRLQTLRVSLAFAGKTWPDRVQIACEELASGDGPLEVWIDAALDNDLFPSAAPFLDTALARGERLAPAAFERCLAASDARASILTSALLADGGDDTADIAIRHLTDEDGNLLEWVAARGPSAERQRAILVSAAPGARSLFALSLFTLAKDKANWPPPQIAQEWTAAIAHLDPTPRSSHQGWQIKRLLQHLAEHNPDIVEVFASSAFQRLAQERHAADARPLTGVLHKLRRPFKTAALVNPDYRRFRALLVCWLVGDDAEWTGEMLQSGTLTPDDVLMAKSGFREAELSIPQLAELLLPYGVAPDRIAHTAMLGMWWGQDSVHFQTLIGQFTGYADSGVPDVARVGRAGVVLFTDRYDSACTAEAAARIAVGESASS
jgi:hypothetical protein